MGARGHAEIAFERDRAGRHLHQLLFHKKTSLLCGLGAKSGAEEGDDAAHVLPALDGEALRVRGVWNEPALDVGVRYAGRGGKRA